MQHHEFIIYNISTDCLISLQIKLSCLLLFQTHINPLKVTLKGHFVYKIISNVWCNATVTTVTCSLREKLCFTKTAASGGESSTGQHTGATTTLTLPIVSCILVPVCQCGQHHCDQVPDLTPCHHRSHSPPPKTLQLLPYIS